MRDYIKEVQKKMIGRIAMDYGNSYWLVRR